MKILIMALLQVNIAATYAAPAPKPAFIQSYHGPIGQVSFNHGGNQTFVQDKIEKGPNAGGNTSKTIVNNIHHVNCQGVLCKNGLLPAATAVQQVNSNSPNAQTQEVTNYEFSGTRNVSALATTQTQIVSVNHGGIQTSVQNANKIGQVTKHVPNAETIVNNIHHIDCQGVMCNNGPLPAGQAALGNLPVLHKPPSTGITLITGVENGVIGSIGMPTASGGGGGVGGEIQSAAKYVSQMNLSCFPFCNV